MRIARYSWCDRISGVARAVSRRPRLKEVGWREHV